MDILSYLDFAFSSSSRTPVLASFDIHIANTKMPCSSLSHRILFISSVLLLVASIGTLGLTGHAKWLLVQYFPADAWYIWRGTDGTYDEQQTTQQWIAIDYNETYDRLAVARAVLGVVASVLSICIMRAKPRAIMEEDTQVLFFVMAVS